MVKGFDYFGDRFDFVSAICTSFSIIAKSRFVTGDKGSVSCLFQTDSNRFILDSHCRLIDTFIVRDYLSGVHSFLYSILYGFEAFSPRAKLPKKAVQVTSSLSENRMELFWINRRRSPGQDQYCQFSEIARGSRCSCSDYNSSCHTRRCSNKYQLFCAQSATVHFSNECFCRHTQTTRVDSHQWAVLLLSITLTDLIT